jgi:two-component system nitrate/nitrite response regulator NarL
MSEYSIEAGKVVEPGKEKPLIRVLTADSTRMNSQMLADVLARDKRFRVLETQTSADGIVEIVENEKPDVVLLSALLENDTGLGFKLTRQIRTAHPATRVVMLLDRSERNSAVEAFRAGASGIFCRSESLKFLPRCIACVHAGQVWANSDELKYLLDALSQAMPPRSMVKGSGLAVLSKREQDVVRGVADGLSNREIAQHLSLTEHTVKNYLFRIFDKLGVSSRVEVVLYAFGLTGAVRLESLDQSSLNQNSTPQSDVSEPPARTRKGPSGARGTPGVASVNEKDSRKAIPI